MDGSLIQMRRSDRQCGGVRPEEGRVRPARGLGRIGGDGTVPREKPFSSGEATMSHGIANLKHRHFTAAPFRPPGDARVPGTGPAPLPSDGGGATRPGDASEIAAGPFAPALPNRPAPPRPADAAMRVL
ncbi:hypothetical protein [Methylobacterium sp. E-046]|uniref:hypothetical protein n=1 Tax=Methylobacterium sp. E-046 TaxID=2836576 RepID=UPI001FBBB478|nr:hypothetical protein [Methylobacterium sp. E-046]MCJ2101296.1 hypothetical protein [Methylobacterium sp. E-046]